ncbi:MAG: murein biosynthesis integral membrane protein MurJ [Pseudomonadota bacterium]
MTLLSRVLGFIRDVVLARLFGAGAGMDVFVVAFQIPNFLRRLFAEGAFAPAFVPVLTQVRKVGDAEDEQAFIDRVAGTLGGILIAVTALGVLGAPVLIFVFSSGFGGGEAAERFDLAVDMLRFTFPYILFISLTALAGAVLNVHERFAVPAFTPVLLNLVLISAAVFLSTGMARPEMGLAVGVLVAGAVQLAFQLPFLRAIGRLPRPRWGWRDCNVQRVLTLMFPAIFGSSVAQLNLLVDRHIASYLETGSISWLYYSDRLLEFPLGLFAVALATVILPRLSARYDREAPQAFSATLDWALRLTALIAVPAAIGLTVLAVPLIATLFQYREFDAHDTVMAGAALTAYGLCLLGFVLVKVLAPGYFSRQDTRTPVRIGIIAMGVNIALNGVFVLAFLRLRFDAPHAGLAAATGVSAFVNAGLLYRGLRREGVYAPSAQWVTLLPRLLAAAALMGVLVWWLAGPRETWLIGSAWDRAGHLALCVLGGAASYVAALWLFGLRPRHLRTPA